MPQKKSAPKKPPTKTELLNAISDETQLHRRDVNAVLTSLSSQIAKSLGRRGAGAFTLPWSRQDREEEGSGPPGSQGSPEPVQAG